MPQISKKNKEKVMVKGFEYVEKLEVEEKLLFLRMIIRMIGKDGKVDANERLFMKNLAEQYQIPKKYTEELTKVLSENEVISEVKRKFNRTSCLFLIKEMLSVANSDGDLDDNEVDFVIKAAHALNIDDDKVMEINQLVLDQMSIDERYKQVMELD